MNYMKKLIFAMPTLALLLVSCGDKTQEEIRDFAIDFAQKVSEGQVDSLLKIYPEATLFDSLALNVVPDSIIVKESDNKNEFVVSLGNGSDITVTKNSEGKMKVISSHGLLAFDKEEMDFAKKTGQWKDGLTDSELAKRMNDKDFESFLIDNFEKEFVKRLSIIHEIPNSDLFSNERKSIYIVKNLSSKQIDGSDYQITIPFFEESFLGDENPKRWNETRKGKTIPPNGSVSFTEYIVTTRGDFSRTGPMFSGHHIEITLTGKALFCKYYESEGNEYEKYLKEKEVPSS